MKRYTIDLKPEVYSALAQLADDNDSTVAEQIRRGIRLLLMAEEIQRNPEKGRLAIEKEGDTKEYLHLL
jgi:hypothetical protein